MADLIGTVQTLLQVGASGSIPEINQRFVGIAPTSPMIYKSQQLVAASTTDATINLGGISNAVMLFLDFTDESTGAARELAIKINGNTTAEPKATQWMFIGSDVAAGITGVTLTTPAGNAVIVSVVAVGA